ncbi:MAG: hypothetical protein QXK47_00960 [Candidatus Bathyarchaeia archaeon]
MTATASTTASRALPPLAKMSKPVLAAFFTPSSPGLMRSGCQFPAPPWTTITGFGVCPSLQFWKDRVYAHKFKPNPQKHQNR